jgi:hypothetical protein
MAFKEEWPLLIIKMVFGEYILLNSPPQGRPLLFKGHFHHRPSLLSGQISCTEVVKYYQIVPLKRCHSSLKAIFTKDHLYYQEMVCGENGL